MGVKYFLFLQEWDILGYLGAGFEASPATFF